MNNVDIITKAKAERITDIGIYYTKDGEERLVLADTVVIAAGAKPDD